MRRSMVLLPLLVVLLTACGERVVFNDEGVDQVVIDATLIVDEGLPPIWISRTLDPRTPIIGDVAGETGATVLVVDGDGNEFEYVEGRRLSGELIAPRGRYLPSTDGVTVRPSLRYDLRVETDRGEVVTATTTTPPRLDVSEWVALDFDLGVIGALQDFEAVGDSVWSVASNQLEWGASLLEARFERDPSVVAYQVSLFSLDPDSDFAIEPDFFEEEDFEELEREGSSPMFEASEGTIRLPWFAVFFEGRYLIKVFATDRNWTDFVNTTPSLSGNPGFGGNAGDGFDRPVFRVDGGIGLFGSASVDSVGFFVFDDDAE